MNPVHAPWTFARLSAEPLRASRRMNAMRVARPVLAAAVLALAVAPVSAVASTRACHSAMRHGVLPSWARTGFSDPRPRMPHVLGRSGEIAAIVFGYPLLSPPSETRANKILWVSRSPIKPSDKLRIRAQRMRGDRAVGRHVVRVIVGGPGPSYLNLPARGCWRLSLQWSGRSDELDLDFRRRS
jgi:hypothetical protein